MNQPHHESDNLACLICMPNIVNIQIYIWLNWENIDLCIHNICNNHPICPWFVKYKSWTKKLIGQITNQIELALWFTRFVRPNITNIWESSKSKCPICPHLLSSMLDGWRRKNYRLDEFTKGLMQIHNFFVTFIPKHLHNCAFNICLTLAVEY